MLTAKADQIFKSLSKGGIKRIFLIPRMMSLSDFDDTIGFLSSHKVHRNCYITILCSSKFYKIDLKDIQKLFLTWGGSWVMPELSYFSWFYKGYSKLTKVQMCHQWIICWLNDAQHIVSKYWIDGQPWIHLKNIATPDPEIRNNQTKLS